MFLNAQYNYDIQIVLQILWWWINGYRESKVQGFKLPSSKFLSFYLSPLP